jgi:hypothetical protein
VKKKWVPIGHVGHVGQVIARIFVEARIRQPPIQKAAEVIIRV